MIANRRAADRQENVDFRCRVDPGAYRVHRVVGDSQVDRFAAPLPDKRPQPFGIGIDDLSRLKHGSGRAQFVTIREDAHAGTPIDVERATIGRCCNGEPCGADQITCVEQYVAFGKVDAHSADELRFIIGLSTDKRIVVSVCIFLDNDMVGTFGNDGAGEDAQGFALSDRAFERSASRRIADDAQSRAGHADIGQLYGIAVHRRHGSRRPRYLCRNRCGQPGAKCSRQRHCLDRKGEGMLRQKRQRLVDADQSAHDAGFR